MKLITNCRKFVMSVVGVFAMIVGASSASPATMIFIQQPKCPRHLLK